MKEVLIVLSWKYQGRVIPCDFIGIVNSQQPIYLEGNNFFSLFYISPCWMQNPVCGIYLSRNWNNFIFPFLCARPGEVVSNHDELMSNFFAQPDALAYGKVINYFFQLKLALFSSFSCFKSISVVYMGEN